MKKKSKYIIIFLLLLFSACNSGTTSSSYIKCGGALNLLCPTGAYCKLSDNCGGLDKKGVCVQIPENCPDEEKIICGCDNNEYKNICIAETVGVTIKNEGTCIQQPSIL